MNEEFENIPAGENDENVESLFEALDEIETDDLAEGTFITLRHDAGAPMNVPLFDGEDSISIRTAIARRNLTVSTALNAYVDGNMVSLDQSVPAGTVVTLVGSVKGG